MPKKKDYPNWFSPYYPPYKPIPPEEFSTTEESTRTYISLSLDDKFDPDDIKSKMMGVEQPSNSIWKLEHYYGDCYYESDTPSLILRLYNVKEGRRDKNYPRFLKCYNNALEKYNATFPLWQDLKNKWDEEVKAETLKRELVEFNRLKKKFEKK
jgi:hypothetical protein